jgi:hypothetical protein
MMNRVEYQQLLRKLYAARRAGNLDELCNMFASHPLFEISGAADAKPIAIRATGSGEFRPWLVLLLELPIRSYLR